VNVIVVCKNIEDSIVVIGEPSNSMHVAVVTFISFNPLYQVKTYRSKNTAVINIQENWFSVNVVIVGSWLVVAKNANMNKEPKNILPKATMLGAMFFSKCFDRVNSAAQNRVAVRIKSSPSEKLNVVRFRSRKFPVSKRIAAMNSGLVSFSLSRVKARIATKINIVLCINAPVAPVVNVSPLKKSRNGIDPPKRPTKDSCAHCFCFNCFSFLYSNAKIIIEKRKIATRVFFAKVKM